MNKEPKSHNLFCSTGNDSNIGISDILESFEVSEGEEDAKNLLEVYPASEFHVSDLVASVNLG